jgi:hypothetical protein
MKYTRVITFEFDDIEDAEAFTDFLRDASDENNMQIVKIENPSEKLVDKKK